MNSVLLTY